LQKLQEIKEEIVNIDFPGVFEFDNLLKKLDNTSDKSNLGGNLILVLSIGFVKLLAKSKNLETYQLIGELVGERPARFPYLYFNLIGGGLHAVNSLPFQEYILVSQFTSPSKGLEYAKIIVEKIKEDISRNFGEIRLGDEGTFSVASRDPELGLEILNRNLDDQGVSLALDVAASSFYKNGEYQIGEKVLNSEQMLELYMGLSKKYPLLSIEDPFSEDDGEGFVQFYKMFNNKLWIVGDDLTVTNKSLIQKAVDGKQITAVIIKPNQIGSVSETLDAVKLARENGLKIIVSHRSGETNDNFIADLAFGVGAEGLKSGAPTQPQRLAKYDRLVEIERQVNKVRYG